MKKVFGLLLFAPFALAAQQRPNIIYIMSDDHDANAISAYNKTFIQTPNIDRIAREGIRFNRAFVANSICGPARATVLTGQFSHKNGFLDNRSRFDSSKTTVPKIMRQAGYQTAMIGKWHLVTLPTGFDYWKVLPGQGVYYQPSLISMNRDTAVLPGYATDVITDEALGWLKEKRDPSKPFALYLHHKAPHRNFYPAIKYLEQYHNKTFPEPATLYEDTAGHGSAWRLQTMSILNDMTLCSDLKVDPAYIMDIPWLKPSDADIRNYRFSMNRIPEKDRTRVLELYRSRGELLQKEKPKGKDLLKYKYQWYMQDYLACVASVDENVGRVLDYLDQSGLAKNTLVMYTSDQGFYMGQNGWFDKRWMYDVSMRTPLMARWPGHIRAGTQTDEMVQNIDIAPTMLKAAGIAVPSFMQGIPLTGIMEHSGSKLPRKSLYYHYYEYPVDHSVLPHIGVRTDRYKLIYFYTVKEWQLIDLQKDPSELKNLVNDPGYRNVLADMKKELIKLKRQYEDNDPEIGAL
ncbi:sulfatase family protein [Sediminibacterium soli]|uniref:sulfatase family protein n=1 Tax=Sediminibacterium soli TaxID=2698829 RepID=UPI0013795B3E|nr:sulfatase [Sediminibacterium soli]NCI45378.1 sulfatase [Sediminibacterium soli]